ncbi:MAG TPA: hypothetical protein VKY92_19080 [Verrucomicrobiae bacterium]|nr:hypothetical protein [Verrucomicrobiae bacterium]
MNSHCIRKRFSVTLSALLLLAGPLCGAIPGPEKLLPDDTLVMLTAPDFAKLRAGWDKSPEHQLWNDPAMRAFREDFTNKWNEQVVKPLERDLDIKLQDYTSLLQGQLTFALIQNAGQGESQEAGMLLLLDTKDKSSQLKKNLAALRKKWADAGKAIKTSKIRDYEFTVVPLSSNDIPKTLRRFLPKSGEQAPQPTEDADSSPAGPGQQLIIGQLDSLLVVSTTLGAAEKIATRVAGGSSPVLGELADFQANQAALFREAPLYAWVNIKAFVDQSLRRLSQKKQDPDAAQNPFDIKPEKILNAIGVTGLKTLAFTFQQASEGETFQLFIGAPESARQGLVKMLAGEPRESRPPPFVPADVVKFQRWRIDGQKTWETIQKMVNDISPQWLNGINFIIETANTAARQKDPGFDFKKNVIGNIGDDMVTYEKAPRGKSPAELRSPPSIFLLGSPNAEVLALSLRSVLVYAGQQPGNAPEEREFLGRKIYSVSLRNLMGPLGAGASPGVPQVVSYAASGGYVAFSTDASMLEEYLRSSDGQRKALREAPGLMDAAQRVIGPGSSMFGYENTVETARARVEELRTNPAPAAPGGMGAANLVPGSLNPMPAVQGVKDLMDFSLLPGFDSISKYFHFSVYGGSANVEGLSLKAFYPTPPGLKPQ